MNPTDNTLELYGVKIKLPDRPPLEEIKGYGLPLAEQRWQREELPEYFNKVEYNKAGDLILTEAQEAFAREEVRRCKEGFWFMNCGEPTYLTGKNYFYLTWWMLEDGIHPDYRDTDRRYYLYLDYWERIPYCLGVVVAKKRRDGATSKATANLIYECIFYKDSKCGLVSKTKEDSKSAFTDMVAFGYRQLPVFLKPKQVNKEDSVTELVFAHKSQGVKEGAASAIKEDEGNRSRVNYKAPVLNSYDSGRVSRLVLDEMGKMPKETPASQLWAIVSKTLVKGVKRVGFAEVPSTTNSLTKGTGAEFKKIWDGANHFKYRPTPNRLVRYFAPAWDGFEGFIDQWGKSVSGEPTPEQYEYLIEKWVRRDEESGELLSELSEEDIRLGSKHYVQVTRRRGLEGELLEEEMRMNPCNEDEAFYSAASDCAFNALNIKRRQKELEEKPVYKRHIKFFRKQDQSVSFQDVDEKDAFHWKITHLPPPGEENKSVIVDGQRRPGRTHDGAIAIDSYTNTQGGKYGSKASAWIGRKFDALNPEESGKPIGWLYGRPKEKGELHEQIMLAAEYYGYKAWYERIADDYYTYFKERGKLGFLGRYPNRLIAPEKREGKVRDYGTPLDEFSLTKQLDDGAHYFQYYCHLIDFEELLADALNFEPHNRTEYDITVSFLILVSCLMEVERQPPPRKVPLIKTYPAPVGSR
jgi:hypothetical protein